MPRFFFHVLDGNVFKDEDGRNFLAQNLRGLMPPGLPKSLRKPVSMEASRSRCWMSKGMKWHMCR
jgi:hypothetical protein